MGEVPRNVKKDLLHTKKLVNRLQSAYPLLQEYHISLNLNHYFFIIICLLLLFSQMRQAISSFSLPLILSPDNIKRR